MTDHPLPTLAEVRDEIIPQASTLLPAIPFTHEANVLLLAIGLQESRFQHRTQIRGPARGFWQFEKLGGTYGVLSHPRTRNIAHSLTQDLIGDSRPRVVNEALAKDDPLACAFARLLLWTDPASLPKLGQTEKAWAYYLRNWRPGKPHRKTWDGLYNQALAAISGENNVPNVQI